MNGLSYQLLNICINEGGLSVDWITGKLYITETDSQGRGTIGVLDPTNYVYKRLLHIGIAQSIVVNPQAR